jgi:poly(A) polymerase
VLGRAADLGGFAAVARGLDVEGARTSANAALLLAALAAWSEGDAEAIADRLRLSNAMRERMRLAVVGSRRVAAGAGVLLHVFGREGACDAVRLAAARGRISDDDAAALRREIVVRDVPVLPIAGRDLLALGVPAGPVVGRLLALAEARWIAQGFGEDRESLLKFCKTQIATILSKE